VLVVIKERRHIDKSLSLNGKENEDENESVDGDGDGEYFSGGTFFD
jgi:hypothetical protein